MQDIHLALGLGGWDGMEGGVYLIVPLGNGERVGYGQPVPVNLKVSGPAGCKGTQRVNSK